MIRQLHYTSCRHGRDGIEGFQVAAATPGIPRRHEDLGLPLAAYRPPPSASAVPSPAALPVSMGFRDLGEVAVLFRSYYVGEDFSGRQGNYVAHLLLADRPGTDLADVVPAAAWEAPFWVRGPLQDRAGTTLPVVPSLAALVPEAQPRPVPAFGALLAVVLDALQGRVRQVVVVADGPDPAAEVAAAVLAVTAALPAHLARQVSFTTFSATPADTDLLVVGTTPGVPLGRETARDRVVLRLAAPPPAAGTAYGQLVRARALPALRALAGRIRPPLRPDELDAFAAAVPLLDGEGDDADPLPGLEFLTARHAAGLGPDVWARVERAVAAGRVRMDELDRWSAVLAAAPARAAVLDAAYLRAALGRLAAGPGSEDLWLPPSQPGGADSAAAWAVAAVAAEPDPATALRVLRTLDRLGTEVADADLATIADQALLPLALDPDGDVAPFRALACGPRLAQVMADQLEERLDDELVAAVAEGMSPDAARWLAAGARPDGRVALATGLRLAAARERDPVALVVAHATDADALDRLLPLAWAGPPPARDGVALLGRLSRPVVTGGALPGLLAHRLEVDAGPEAGPDLELLADRLDALGDDLPEATRDAVDAVLLAAWFRRSTVHARESRERVRAAARTGSRADPALARPLARALVHWLFVGDLPEAHAATLEDGLAAGMAELVPAYTERLVRTLAAAEPPVAVGLIAAVATVAASQPAAAALLSGPCAEALGRRRRKDLDEIGARFAEKGGVPRSLRAPGGAGWLEWWRPYRAAIPAPDLRDRLRLFGRGG